LSSRSLKGERLIARPRSLAAELERHHAASNYSADTDYVFGHPTKGSRLDGEWFRLEFAKAREAAGIEGCVRIHDLRHAALTNLAAKGASPIAVAQRRDIVRCKHKVVSAPRRHDVRGRRGCAGSSASSGRNLYPTELTSDDLTESEVSVQA